MHRGLTILFTGLSGAGKTTLAQALQTRLNAPSHLLDGDTIRKLAPQTLSFTPQDRIAHIKHVGNQAQEITKQNQIAICALIAPYENIRKWLRNHILPYGNFLEIYVCTPLEICEQRDVKGLYKKARNQEISHFTGISDPYEIPTTPDLVIDTHLQPLSHAIGLIGNKLKALGYL